MTIRILVIDDHPMVRAGVRAELENSGADLEVVGDASDVEGAIAAVHALRPDVVLLDVHLPGGNGGGGAEVVASCHDVPETRFLALSVSDASDDVVGVIRAGARGYVTKAISAEDLADAVRRVAAGDAAFSPRRKTLHAALRRFVPDEAFDMAGIDPTRRGETLTIDEFVALARALDAIPGEVNAA